MVRNIMAAYVALWTAMNVIMDNGQRTAYGVMDGRSWQTTSNIGKRTGASGVRRTDIAGRTDGV